MRTHSGESDCGELERAIERQIARRAWGRIRRLRVEAVHDRVTVHGEAPSYHIKQLAIRAVLEVLDSIGPPPVDLDIQVGVREPAAT